MKILTSVSSFKNHSEADREIIIDVAVKNTGIDNRDLLTESYNEVNPIVYLWINDEQEMVTAFHFMREVILLDLLINDKLNSKNRPDNSKKNGI